MTNPARPRTARDSIINPSGLIQAEFLRVSDTLLTNALRRDTADIAAVKQELALLPGGSLHIHKSRTGFSFGECGENSPREVGITSDPVRIHHLARRAYLQSRIRMLERNTRRLHKMLASCEEARAAQRLRAKLQRDVDAGLDLARILFTEEQNEWLDEPYSPNPYYPENLVHRTTGGIPVRSKSEAKLGSFAESVGLPFRSDDLVTIRAEHGGHPARDNYYADFKFPNFCGGITIHEHLGAFHLDAYADNALKRLNDYHNFAVFELSGIPVQHEEITWSFEHDLYTSEALHTLLRRILFPIQE